LKAVDWKEEESRSLHYSPCMEPRSTNIQTIDPEFLCTAYCSGYFPMADPKTGEISWYSPDPRTIFELETFHIPHSLKLTLKKQPFEIRINHGFEEVMRACAQREDTWISEGIIKSYIQLYSSGFAHSVETWKDETLVGGLYGVAIRGAFFGESMFSRIPDASKVALVHLVMRIKERGYSLLDIQSTTKHLKSFGSCEIARNIFIKRLDEALQIKCKFIN
jgi:leucyl/phenylalanyl-tRNA---protein transferase